MVESEARSEALGFADYAGILWRRKWVIVVAALVSTAAAFAYSLMQTPRYEATAQLVYAQPIDPTNPIAPVTSSTSQDLALQSAVYAVETPIIVERAEAILGGSSSDYEVTADISGVSSTTDDKTGFMSLQARGPDPRTTAAIANAYAQAVIEWRQAQVLDKIRIAEAAVLAEQETYATSESKNTSEYLALTQQLQRLKLLAKAASADVQLVAPAAIPKEPFAPQTWRAVVLGLGLGLLVGLALALLLDQLGSRADAHQRVQPAQSEADDSRGTHVYVRVAGDGGGPEGRRHHVVLAEGAEADAHVAVDVDEGGSPVGERRQEQSHIEDDLVDDGASADHGTERNVARPPRAKPSRRPGKGPRHPS